MYLRKSTYGLFYACEDYPTCKGAHGAHQNSGKPLGIPATQNVKRWRMKAHSAFDPIWKNGYMDRHTAYKWITAYLGLDIQYGEEYRVHIGAADIQTCKKIIQASQEFLSYQSLKLPRLKGKLPIDK